MPEFWFESAHVFTVNCTDVALATCAIRQSSSQGFPTTAKPKTLGEEKFWLLFSEHGTTEAQLFNKALCTHELLCFLLSFHK